MTNKLYNYDQQAKERRTIAERVATDYQEAMRVLARAARDSGFQARSKDQEILEEGGGAGPSLLPRRDHE